MPPSSVLRMSSMPRTAIWAAVMRSWTAPGLPSAPLSEWTWQSMMPGISVPPAVSTLSPAKPVNSAAGAMRLTLPSSSSTACPSRTFSPSNTRPPTYNVAIDPSLELKLGRSLPARPLRGKCASATGRSLRAAQRIGRRIAAHRLQARDLVVDSHDVRIVLLGQLEGGDGARILAHFRADHAKPRIGAEMARLALYRLADVVERSREVAEQPVRRRPLVPGLGEIGCDLDQLAEGLDRLFELALLHLGDAAHHQLALRAVGHHDPLLPDRRLQRLDRHGIGRRL